MRHVIAFGRFWYDFVVGDDWRIAAGVALLVAVAGAAVAAGASGDPVAITVAVGTALLAAAGTILSGMRITRSAAARATSDPRGDRTARGSGHPCSPPSPRPDRAPGSPHRS
jgi:hypothetical protein